MKKRMFRGMALLLCVLLAAACADNEGDVKVAPVERTRDLSGYQLVVNATVGAATRMSPETGAWQSSS